MANLAGGQLRNPKELDVNLKLEFGPFETVHKWKRMSECNEFVGARRSKHTAVAYKDAIYMFGGDNGKSMLNDMIRFDIIEKSWTRTGSLGTPPAPRYHHSAVVHRSSMFVFGGYTGDILANSNLTNKNDLFEYKFQSAQWVQWKFTGPEPVPRSAHGAAVYDDKLWIFGGYDGNARLNDMWTIDLLSENHQWQKVEQLGECPPTCCNFPVTVARGKMFVFSGQSGAKITNALFQFDFETRTWNRVCTEHLLRCANPAPTRRYGHVMLSHGRRLYVFGGAADHTLPRDLHCYDLDNQMWSVITPAPDSQPPSGRLFHAAAVAGDAMYVFGGTVDNNVRSGELFRFQLSNYPGCSLRDDLGLLLRTKQFCDVSVKLSDGQIKWAHIAMLAARSPYCKKKIEDAQTELLRLIEEGKEPPLQYPLEEPRITIDLPEASPAAFKMVLNYIYTDRIDPTEKDEDPASPDTIMVVMAVLRLAAILELPRLSSLCERYLQANLCYGNVLQSLEAAHFSGMAIVKDHCMRFLSKDYNFAPIVMSPQFEKLDRDLMVEVIRMRQQPPAKGASSEVEVEIPGTTLEQDMCVFLNGAGDLLSDIYLAVGDVKKKAHRSILIARSGYFEGMCRHASFAPPHLGTVNIQICDAVLSEAALESLMRYIYYGGTHMQTEDSLYLFQAPIYYTFTNNRLQVFCKNKLQREVSPDNVLAILEAADRMQAADIKEYALKMTVHHFVSVTKQEAFNNLPRLLLLDIIKALAKDPRFADQQALVPYSHPSSTIADITDDPDYGWHKTNKS